MAKRWAHTNRPLSNSIELISNRDLTSFVGSLNVNIALERSLFLFALCILSFGCDTGPDLYPVSGTVSVKGKPLDVGRIIFEPVGEGVSAVGDIGAGGEFELFTVVEGDGVAVGTYYPVVMDPKNDERAKRKRLGVVQMDTTKFEVTAEGPNEFDININAEDLEYSVSDD